jgi:hypothetical protein
MRKFTAAAMLGAMCSLLCASQAFATTVFSTKLFLSSDGVALSSFPSHRALKQTITVTRTSGHTPVTWNAVSDQSWLKVTASGTTKNGALKLQAKTDGLSLDQSYVAKVTVSTVDGDFSDSETLYVGLWVGSKDPKTVTQLWTGGIEDVVVNPVLPIAYVTDAHSDVTEYNVYSGQKVGMLKNISDTLRRMTVSSDGQTLFVEDENARKVFAVDLNTGHAIAHYTFSGNAFYNMVYARPYGQPALYMSGTAAIAIPSGDTLVPDMPEEYLAVTADGRHLASVTWGVDPANLSSYAISLKKGALAMTSVATARMDRLDNCEDLAISHDGSRLYPACGSPYEFDVFDAKSLEQVQTLTASNYPNNIAIDSNDDAVCGLYAPNADTDVWVYNKKARLLGTVPSINESGQQTAVLHVTGDATRIVSVADTPNYPNVLLSFRNMP